MDLTPIWLTLKLAAITTLILLLIGLPLAWWLSKKRSFVKIIIEAIITMPLVLPPSVLGFYLLLAFSPQRGLGHWLQQTFDVQFVFSFQGLVLASVIYSMPFMISPVKSAFQQLPQSLSQASYTLGKSQWQTFRYVLLPNIKPSLLTAAVLTFAHTLGEFGVVLMIGGNIPGVTRVASIAVYDSVEQMNYTAANNYSLVLFAITFVMVLSVFIYNKYQAKSPLE
ncbi:MULTISPECIES: molybdate ABC transporter permease subunit [unclassified Mucilaginibacter]|uniref:molybdate ABC transporter permease subunit n=1 Tax=unclassified Mucilaginibacter TaxID=2617802 RepID=UPI002AC95B3A|nr:MULTISPECIES: molybdate ABC transporter permease subunit [unclassified Mucilaginibacter]MEB0260912.1 molybdate ABC transporter permease subunit [Mucilaginibacter sp. 10I4]MEB0279851.1 molybdate ABC transporter permease subunit [Mucilaginibacter sp. 10B2]MEB0303213.1 molybdate ABC transporter permease subunit [Mucilaginibacter sp. 5C4]WPX24178.1 molybdate ABC transporter permease subunit [Mucilaginibacter sp. 5C4]